MIGSSHPLSSLFSQRSWSANFFDVRALHRPLQRLLTRPQAVDRGFQPGNSGAPARGRIAKLKVGPAA
jgi:hypothetical protein